MDENQFYRDLVQDLQDPRFKRVFTEEMLRLQRQRLLLGLRQVRDERARRTPFFAWAEPVTGRPGRR